MLTCAPARRMLTATVHSRPHIVWRESKTARRGASVFKMRDVSRHKSMDVLQAYVRDADLFRDRG
jgi:hypothetical protein